MFPSGDRVLNNLHVIIVIILLTFAISTTNTDSVQTILGRTKGTGALLKPIESLANIIDFYNKTLVLEKTLKEHADYNPADLIDDQLSKIQLQLEDISTNLKSIETQAERTPASSSNKAELMMELAKLFQSISGDKMMEAYLKIVKTTEDKLVYQNETLAADMNEILEDRKSLAEHMTDLESVGIYLRQSNEDYLKNFNSDDLIAILFDNSFLSVLLADLQTMHQMDDLQRRYLLGEVETKNIKWEGELYPMTKLVEIMEELEAEFDAKIKNKNDMLTIFKKLIDYMIDQQLVKQTIEINDKYKNVGLELKSMADEFIDKHENLERRFLKLRAKLNTRDEL